ncbi:hypothetical protein [Flavobacterium sp. J27]|uniref:hypothetical protein n=1 Tax=Flavobacterium sp. J27 TaxID=2060419 RepID=UPI00102FAB15|nr:hypothetical protein [Flavobacterium sp. J27]
MKNFLRLLVIVALFQSFQCEKEANKTSKTTDFETLQKQKQHIKDYVASFECNEEIGCDFMAFGSKPCGGPWEYLIYSNEVDITYLTTMVNQYNQDEANYNIQYHIFSDCAVVNPPNNVGCVDGVCTIIQQ